MAVPPQGLRVMATFDADSAECWVLTAAEGLVSTMAHDLRIRVTVFHIEVDEVESAIDARFDPASLRVEGATSPGDGTERRLSRRDKEKIDRLIVRDVLQAERYPAIRFVGAFEQKQDAAIAIRGQLDLCGQRQALAPWGRRESELITVEALVHQPDFGIRPYSALFGGLKVKPTVRIRLKLPAVPNDEAVSRNGP